MIQEINKMFQEQLDFAERNQKCLRKAVGCTAITVSNIYDASKMNNPGLTPLVIEMAHNGPSREDQVCSNVVGNCGCSHAEPRVVQAALEEGITSDTMPLILLCTYSPCTNCANIIIDSGLFVGCIYQILTVHDTRGEKFLREAMHVMTVDELNTLTEKEASDRIKQWISG
jgi:deoxycytidylate deaminase